MPEEKDIEKVKIGKLEIGCSKRFDLYYIRFNHRRIKTTIQNLFTNDRINIDRDRRGKIVGIEILGVK